MKKKKLKPGFGLWVHIAQLEQLRKSAKNDFHWKVYNEIRVAFYGPGEVLFSEKFWVVNYKFGFFLVN